MDDGESTKQKLDTDRYSYVADKGPITALGLSGDNEIWFETLRIFGLRSGYSSVSGIPGFYLVNTAGMLGDVAPVCTHSLPALLHPADTGLPPVYGLRWKIGQNGNIYAMTIATDLKQSSDADSNEKWLTEADVVPRRLDLFAAIEPIENRDGQPMAKKFDEWIKQHSSHFSNVKIRSLAAARAWQSHSKFGQQIETVIGNAVTTVRTSVRDSAGVSQEKRQKKSAKDRVDPAVDAEIDRQVNELNTAVAPLIEYVRQISVPIGHRLIELDLGSAEGEVSMDQLPELLKVASPANAAALLELMKSADKVELLQKGSANIEFHSSPLPRPVPKAVPEVVLSGSDSEEEVPIALKSGKNSISSADGSGSSSGKRVRKQTHLFTSPDSLDSQDDKPAKRKYEKTGKYSKDQLKAAAANAKSRSGAKQKGAPPPPPAPYPPLHRTANPSSPSHLPAHLL